MSISSSTINNVIHLNPVAYSPRVLCGIATIVSIFAFGALIGVANPTIAFQLSCIRVSLYSAITAAALMGLSLIRDTVAAVLLLSENHSRASEKILENYFFTLASPFIAGGLILWGLINKK